MIFLVIFSLLHFALLYIMVNIKYVYSICGHPININKLMTLQERLRINSILHCFVILFACMYFFFKRYHLIICHASPVLQKPQFKTLNARYKALQDSCPIDHPTLCKRKENGTF